MGDKNTSSSKHENHIITHEKVLGSNETYSLYQTSLKAKKKWIRLEPDKTAQGYNTWAAEANYDDPEWPDLTIQQYLEIAFKNTQIVSEDHPKIKQLFGRV